MSSILHMETDQVRETGKRLDQAACDIQNQITSLGGRLRGLNWQSPARDAFISEYNQLEKQILERANEAATLGLRVQREVDEWEQAAMALVAGSTVTPEERRSRAIDDARRSIQDAWKEMTTEERSQWLENWYKDLCKKLGMPPVDFKVKDLKDPEGKDARGVYNDGSIFGLFRNMAVDVDNVKGDDPFQVMETVAHETRHQYQHYLVQHPDKRPDHVSEEQIKSWEENFKNYRRPEDDFEAYRDQPVEKDARESGEQAAREYIESKAEAL